MLLQIGERKLFAGIIDAAGVYVACTYPGFLLHHAAAVKIIFFAADRFPACDHCAGGGGEIVGFAA